jgi:hypothetical protein
MGLPNNRGSLLQAHPGTLRKFFQQHNCRSAEKTEERIAAVYQATSALLPKMRSAGSMRSDCTLCRALARAGSITGTPTRCSATAGSLR